MRMLLMMRMMNTVMMKMEMMVAGDGNQNTNHRHIAMILWPGYYDTEVNS